jgi:hypothetical protein
MVSGRSVTHQPFKSPNSKVNGRRARQKHHPLERRSKAATLKLVSFLRRSLPERRNSHALENREADCIAVPARPRRDRPASTARPRPTPWSNDITPF